MFTNRQLVRLFLAAPALWCLLTFVPLLAGWHGPERAYAYVYRSYGNILFARFWIWPDAGVRFLDLESLEAGDVAPGAADIEATGDFDTLMELRLRRSPSSIAYGYLRTSCRLGAYWPTAMLIALVVATPVPWSRRGWALLWGVLLVHVFIALKLTLTLTANGFAAPGKRYALFEPSQFWREILVGVEGVVSDNPVFPFVVALFVWLLVTLFGGMWVAKGRNGQRTEPAG